VPLVPLNYRLGQRQVDALLARHPNALGIADPDAQAHLERAGVGGMTTDVVGSAEFASAGEAEAALVSVPPYHIAAVANVITNLYAARRALVLEAFTPDQWLRTVREEEVTGAMVVPTMLARIIDGAGDKSVPSLRTLPTAVRRCQPPSSNGHCGSGRT
jgi:hypothetical protein